MVIFAVYLVKPFLSDWLWIKFSDSLCIVSFSIPTEVFRNLHTSVQVILTLQDDMKI